MRYTAYGVGVAVLAVSLTSLSLAQSTGIGFPSFSSQAANVSLNNLSYTMTIPIIGRQGRGIPANYALHYNSPIYTIVDVIGSGPPKAFAIPPALPLFGGLPTFGWNTNGQGFPIPPPLDMSGGLTSTSLTCGTGTKQRWTFVDMNGTTHSLPDSAFTSTDPNCAPAQVSGYATDQSGIFISVNSSGSGFAQDSNGNVYPASGGPNFTLIKDRNGNTLTGNSQTGTLTDTLGTTAISFSLTTDAAGNIQSNTYTYPAPGGTTASVIVKYKIYPRVASGFGCPNVGEYSMSQVGIFNPLPGVPLVDTIVLPNNSEYQFTYEPTPPSSPFWVAGSVTGRLQSVTLPTGATVSYGYPGPNGGINCSDATALGLTETTSDGTMTYNRSVSGTTESTTVTDPQNNQTVIKFVQLTNPQTFNVLPNFIEAQRQTYQGSSNGTLLETQIKCYNGNKVNCSSTPVTMPITETSLFVQLPNGKMNERDQFLDAVTGLAFEVDEYDFGSGQPGLLLRKTLTRYASLNNNILNHPMTIIACAPGGADQDCNGSGTKVGQTTFGYDETPIASTSGILQHASVSGSRGNMTSINHWLNTNNSILTTTNTFDDTGNIVTTTDPGGHTTTFVYGTGSCNGAFVTQINLPDTHSPNLAHHETSTSYDCNTAMASSSTDENGNVTRFLYDSMFRPIEVDFPDGGQTITSYPDANHSVVQSKIDNLRSTYSTKEFDGYGRLSRQAAKNDESTQFDQQDFCYDPNGRLRFKSYPYQGSGFSTAKVCSGTGDTFDYDALGRATKVTHSDGSFSSPSYAGTATQTTDEGNGTASVTRISQRDGLGRLASVCEVYSGAPLMGSGGTPASCGLDISGSGFLTTYGYDIAGNLTRITQGALTSRTYAYDSLSRMTSESTPEGGTVSYNYNADGLLSQRVRPIPNQTDATKTITTTYGYDELHRDLSRTYTSSDPINHPVNTGSPLFNYDETGIWNTTLTNTSGRMTSQIMYGPPGSGSTVVTAEQIFSYDRMGRTVLNAQCTPNTCNVTPLSPYSLGYQYDLLGNVVSAGNGVGVNFGYSYNIASRLTGMTSSLNDAGHPGTLLSNVHYTPVSITDTLGNGVAETLAFSPRAMLTSYTGTALNGQPGTGSIIIGGALKTYQQQVQAATNANGSVTISGTEQSVTTGGDSYCAMWNNTGDCVDWEFNPSTTTYDSGTITVTVNGHSDAYSYGQGDTISSIATGLAVKINGDSGAAVTAAASGGTVNLTSKATGTAANYVLASTSSYDSADFGAPSFTTGKSGSALTGGQNAVFQTAFDNGSTAITVNSHVDSFSWSGSATTAASIIAGLCNTINSDNGAFVTASTNGAQGQCPLGSTTLTLASKQGGQNYSLSASSNSVVSSFSTGCPGFPSCTSASLTGGGNPAYSFTLGHAADGQVTSANDFVNGNWAFGYDQFNRLASSNKNSGQQTFSYVYDRYSNRWQQNAPQGGPAPQYMFDNNNHFVGSGVTYDALGNITNDGFHTYTYDDENRVIQADGGATAAYGYDAEGRRVHGPNGEYVYDQDGRMITQIALNGVWAYGEIYAGGNHFATYSGGTTNFLHSDWLGTKRVMTALNGMPSETCTGFAFGDGVNCTGTNWSFNGFTDDIHDSETNLEHTLFRQLSGTQGRWLTPDPAGMGSMNTANPQSLNRYAYVMNDPVNSVDPMGLEIDPGQGGCFMDINCTNVGGVTFATWISHYVGMQCNVDGVQEDCAWASFLLRAGKAGVQVGTTQVRVEFPGGTDSDSSWLPAVCCDEEGDSLVLFPPVPGMMTRRDAVYVSIAVVDTDSIPPDLVPTRTRQALINMINCGSPWPFPCGPISIGNGDPTYHPPAHPHWYDVVSCMAGKDPENNDGPEARHVPEGNSEKARVESFSPSGRAKQNNPETKRWNRPMNQKGLKSGYGWGGGAAYAGNTMNCIGTSNMY